MNIKNLGLIACFAVLTPTPTVASSPELPPPAIYIFFKPNSLEFDAKSPEYLETIRYFERIYPRLQIWQVCGRINPEVDTKPFLASKRSEAVIIRLRELGLKQAIFTMGQCDPPLQDEKGARLSSVRVTWLSNWTAILDKVDRERAMQSKREDE